MPEAIIAVVPVGAPGTFAGVTTFDASEVAEAPPALEAVTLKEYGVPVVRPITVHNVPEEEQVKPPGIDIAV